MGKQIFCGKGTHIPYAEYMDFINLVFGFTTPEQQFEGLLPKLYKASLAPQGENYVVTEDGKLVAAVGAYSHEITVCGIKLPCRGIGNVAVHPEARGRGYMKVTMNAALKDMIRDGIALSTLGGRRQRYQYFSYDKAGPAYTFSITRDNLRHTYGTLEAPYTVKVLEDPKDPLIEEIMAIAERAPFLPTRSREAYLDIANTWKARLLAFLEDGAVVGYGIMDQGNAFSEIRGGKEADFMSMIRSASAFLDSGLSVKLPVFDVDYIRAIDPVAEYASLATSMSYTVLNYGLVLEAFLKLKQTYTSLTPGTLKLLIHGYGGDEALRLRVTAEGSTVEKISDEEPMDLELDHLEALSCLFSPISPRRELMSELVKNWFPLPLWMYRADEV